VKLFVHTTQETQDERLAARINDPWKRWKINIEDFRNRAHRSAYLKAIHDMFAQTDTRWAPWKVIDGNSKKRRDHRADILPTGWKRMCRWIRRKADPDVMVAAEAALGGILKRD